MRKRRWNTPYPEDAEDEKLRGKTVEYHVKIQSVKSMKLPELTDEFAQTLGEYTTVEALRQSIKERMQTNDSEEYDQNYATQLVDKVRVMSTIKYSPHDLQDEIEEITRQLERDLTRQSMDMETYLKYRKMEKDQLVEDELKPAAIRRLERSLVINEVGKAEKIQLDQQSLQGIVTQTLSQMESSGELKKLRRNLSNERLVDAVMFDTASRMMNNQVLARLKAIATGQAEELPSPPAVGEAAETALATVESEAPEASTNEATETASTVVESVPPVASTNEDEAAIDLSTGAEESSPAPTSPESEA